MRKNRNSRIGIIGAGAAGLTAAETLQGLGYTNITLLEKNDKAGGKCCSYKLDGKVYELGAGLIAENNKTIIDLINRYNVRLKRVTSYTDNLYDVETGTKIKDFFKLPEKISFLWQLLMKYRRLCHQNEPITKPGYDLTDLSLCKNFNEWAEENEIPLVLKNFERYFTGFGYGYWEEIPAAYVLKYMDWDTVKSFIRGNFYTFPDGIQSLWIEMASQHHVIYDSEVKSMKKGNVIKIETSKQSYEFDHVLVSSALDEYLKFTDPSEEEEFLFSKILYNDYHCYAYTIENFTGDTGFLPEYFDPLKINQPLFWYKAKEDSDFYTFYILSDWKTSQNQIQENIENVIHKFGGIIKQFHICKKWKYFPHYSPENMKLGFYDRLEKLQGKNNTYFIGELPSFSTVELTAFYAKQLVIHNF